MKPQSLISALLVSSLLLVGMTTSADDGEKTLKSMSRNASVTVTPEEVGVPTSEAEHAFTDMMKFYVPSQAASGLIAPVDYINADGGAVETLIVAKPLVNVFIYGPAIGVEGTPFAHSFMDTFAATSLDDGVTWKTTNMSESADLSSFDLDTDHNPSGGDPLPGDHNIRLGNAFHAKGYDTPYTAHCSECHGQGLQGVAQVPSCYSCHKNNWAEATPVDIGPIIYMAELEGQYKANSKLKIMGENAADSAEVTILNAITGHPVGTTEARDNGEFAFEEKFKDEELPPCVVMAEYTDDTGTVLTGPSLSVKDKKTGEPIENCEGLPQDLTNYPGGVHNVFHATQGNKVLAAWPSRFCEQGKPAYALGNDEERLIAILNFIQTGETADDTTVPALGGFNLEDDLYLVDAFGVAGQQGSLDFADEGYPQAGVVPFGCVWTSRGVLLPGDDPRTGEVEASHMVWTKAERLTSGRRDPFRIEVKAVKGAGFVITWQEDPEGLRPGQGLGPGEGWSGAVAHSQTDVWYSFVNWEYFDYVDNGEGAAINIVNHDLTTSGRPQVFVPMAIPMRLTNNAKCNTDGTNVTDPDLYCNDEGTDEVAGAADYGLKNQCVDTVEIPTGPNDTPTPICISEDGLPNVANTASTRPRLSLQASGTGSAWVIVAAEESKGLGKLFSLPDGTPCEEGSSVDCTEEIGKNQWYFSFDMGSPDTSADLSETGLVKNLVNQGNMLNQPEVDWRTGEFYPELNTADLWGFGTYDFNIFNTEIARRSSLLVQSITKASASTSGLLATPSWKQGPMRQGGPADTMLRRVVDQGTSANPYAFTNIVCGNWAYADGSNPYYPDGVCMDPATNLSGVVPDTCIDSDGGADIACPTVDFISSTFGIGDTDPILQGQVQGEGNTMKVLTWHQCPSDGTQATGDITAVTCADDDREDAFVNLKDQSWYNPLDVSKGHRGFIDGDMVMFLYAWSPNWRLNAKGSDRYELYVRRSFDGGATWSTTPSSGTAGDGVTSFNGDGTVTCETYRSTDTGGGGIVEPHVCYEYGAGAAEQARNITQHQAMRITTLDPRYAASAASIGEGCMDYTDPTIDISVMTCDDLSIDNDSDLRDPSRYFMVYETGDNTTVEVGEAEPLDLFYGRAINFGDDYVVWADEVVDSTLATCYPSDPHDDDVPEVLIGSGFCNEFDRMNAGGDSHSSEANLEANPDGSKLYGVWAQWGFDAGGEEIVESDAMARRIWWIDGYIPLNAWDFGQGTGANP
jgi:hypothetical protein